MPGFVRVEMEDRLAILTINRPDALNALNTSVLRELSMAIEHLSMAADVGAIILTGPGTARCCGSRHQRDGRLVGPRNAILL